MSARAALPVVFAGHVDHGKSTLIGRLLLDTHSLPSGKLAEARKIARDLGSDAELAFLVDQLKEERERGITMDAAQTFLRAGGRRFTIIDVPGHAEFLRNMITGATEARAAVLIVAADQGPREQTRRHAFILNLVGVREVVVAVNKMDLARYSRTRFAGLKSGILKTLKGFNLVPRAIVPISAAAGVNVARRSRETPWYAGPSLLEAMRSFEEAAGASRPMRFPVQDVYEIDGEKVLVGRVASGVVRRGQKAVCLPSGRPARIAGIRVWRAKKSSAGAGESVGLVVKGAPAKGAPGRETAKRGDVLAQADPAKGAPGRGRAEASKRVRGNVFWMSSKPLRKDERVTLRCATQAVPCRAVRIEKRIDPADLKILKRDASRVERHEAAVVRFEAERPLVTESFSFVEDLGRFTLERGSETAGAGIVE